MAELTDIVGTAAAQNKTVQLPFVTWVQAESNYLDTNYKADLFAPKNSCNVHALDITKHPNRPRKPSSV